VTAAPGLSVQPLAADALTAVVALHRQALPTTLNSRLGADHLGRLYQAMQRDATCRVQVAQQAGQVVGVVSVALDPAHFVSRFMAQQRPRHWLALAAQLARHPTLLRDWQASQALNRPVYWQGQPVRPCLSAIAVAAAAGAGRGPGAGRQRRRLGAGQRLPGAYYLDTLVENHRPRLLPAVGPDRSGATGIQ
jgi:hypothetical protein